MTTNAVFQAAQKARLSTARQQESGNFARNRHAPQYDRSGGPHAVLGDWSVACICGKKWTTSDSLADFSCPQEAKISAHSTAAE